MRIGVPREVKDGEARVGIVPEGVARLVAAGHELVVERGAGRASGYADEAYAAAGARLFDDATAIYRAELVVKVKELQPQEWPLLSAGTTLFGFAQLSRDPALLDAVLRARIRYIAYETIADAAGDLPLLAAMSRIAGRLAPLIAARLLMNDHGGSGVLLPGVGSVEPGRVVVLGAGNVGGEAAAVATGMGCDVTVFARSARRFGALQSRLSRPAQMMICSPELLAPAVAQADVIIGAVLEPGRLSPRLLARSMVRSMRHGSVLVDVGIDQGGIAETSRMTQLSAPTYIDEGVIHYCVPNMPALVPRTATLALAGATLPYVRVMAARGIQQALDEDPGLRAGMQVSDGRITHAGLAADAVASRDRA